MKAEENPMNKQKYIYLIAGLFVLLLTSACGTQLNSGSSDIKNTVPSETNQENTATENDSATNSGSSDTTNTKSSEINQENTAADDDSANSTNEILIIIDQTSKPIEGNSFDFVVNKVPEGFSLTEIQWLSKKTQIINTVQEAIEHGKNGEDGFYISGNGQYSGFIYPDTMKGEEGQVVFLFKDAQGKELTWKKKITLN
jgi:Fe-S cluster assembly iron-binding protein IscA